jgi:hypothetical protein
VAALTHESHKDERRYGQLRKGFMRLAAMKADRSKEVISTDPMHCYGPLFAAFVERQGLLEGDMLLSAGYQVKAAARCGYLRLSQNDLPHVIRLAYEDQVIFAVHALTRSRDLSALETCLLLTGKNNEELQKAALISIELFARQSAFRNPIAAFMSSVPETSVSRRWSLARCLIKEVDVRGMDELGRILDFLLHRKISNEGDQTPDLSEILGYCIYGRILSQKYDLPELLEKVLDRLHMKKNRGELFQKTEKALLRLACLKNRNELWAKALDGEEVSTLDLQMLWSESDSVRLSESIEGKNGEEVRRAALSLWLRRDYYCLRTRTALRRLADKRELSEKWPGEINTTYLAIRLLNYLGDPADITRLRVWARRWGSEFLVGLSRAGENVLPLLKEKPGVQALLNHFEKGMGPRCWRPENYQLNIPETIENHLELSRRLINSKDADPNILYEALHLLLRDDLSRPPARLTDKEYGSLAAMMLKHIRSGRLTIGLLKCLESFDHPAFTPVSDAVTSLTSEPQTCFRINMPPAKYALYIKEARSRMNQE